MLPNRAELSVFAKDLLLNVTKNSSSNNYRRLHFLSVFRFPLRHKFYDVLDTLRIVSSEKHVVSCLATQLNERLVAE